MKNAVLLTAAALCALSINVNAETTLYDIDFSSPLHSVGSTPATGSSTQAVTWVSDDKPIVLDSFGVLTNQPLVYNPEGKRENFDHNQIGLHIYQAFKYYHLSFQMTTEDLINSGYLFGVVFDPSPELSTMYGLVFDGAEGMTLLQSTEGNNTILFLGAFNDNALFNISIDIDLINNVWSIDSGLVPVHTGIFNSDIASIRFLLQPEDYDTEVDPTVAIDNITLTASNPVPEPGALCLFGLGSFFYGARRMRRFHNVRK